VGAQRHSIKRQVVELTLADSRDTWRLQQELGRIYRQRLVPLIERDCDELSTPDCLYRLERLELDLGTIDIDHLESELVAKVSAQLKPRLAEQIERQERSSSAPDDRPEVLSQLELFSQFIHYGSLPWWADLRQPRLLADNLHYLLRYAPVRLRSLLSTLIREKRNRQRLIRHYDDAQLTALATLLVPGLETFLTRLLPALVELLTVQRLGVPARLKYAVWSEVLQLVSRQRENYQEMRTYDRAWADIAYPDTGNSEFLSFGRELLRRVARNLGLSYPDLLAGLRQTSKPATVAIQEDLTPLIVALERDSGEESTAIAVRSVAKSANVPPARRNGRKETTFAPDRWPVPSELTADDRDIMDDTAEEVYLDTAGLVLLWPFLGRFFERLGLLAAERFKDATAVQRAVGLLHYLATEETEPPEYRLPLAKVLCGMEPEAVFLLETPLSAEEMKECTLLLSAVIEHAPILRNMSIAGFRGTFLLRHGILGQRDGAWLLRVERETYDIVLERFPWTVNWVKLPWMTAPLRVEW
jgi:hypothetical protein